VQAPSKVVMVCVVVEGGGVCGRRDRQTQHGTPSDLGFAMQGLLHPSSPLEGSLAHSMYMNQVLGVPLLFPAATPGHCSACDVRQ
jgi:hypothetical protein